MFEKIKKLLADALKHTNKQTPTNDQKSAKSKLQQAIEHLNELEAQEADAQKTIDGLKADAEKDTNDTASSPATTTSNTTAKKEIDHE